MRRTLTTRKKVAFSMAKKTQTRYETVPIVPSLSKTKGTRRYAMARPAARYMNLRPRTGSRQAEAHALFVPRHREATSLQGRRRTFRRSLRITGYAGRPSTCILMNTASLGLAESDPSTGSGQAPTPGPSKLGTTAWGGRLPLWTPARPGPPDEMSSWLLPVLGPTLPRGPIRQAQDDIRNWTALSQDCAWANRQGGGGCYAQGRLAARDEESAGDE